MALPVDAWKLEGISPRAYQHPADRAATAALHKVPYLDDVVRKLIALGYERALRASALGSSVRLGQEQLPHIWVLHRQSFNALDLEDVPDLYLTQFPFANAATIGTDRPVVVVNSELVRILDDDGRRAVLAHEAAHVHSGHVLYQTAMLILLRIASGVRLPLLAGLPLLAIQLALLEWFRGAELSCDRAAALVTRDPHGRLPRPHGHLGRRGLRRAQPRRLHRPGHGLQRGRPGPREAHPADGRHGPDAPDAGAPRAAAARVGARGRVRPDRRRRLHPPRPRAAAARGGRRRPGALLQARVRRLPAGRLLGQRGRPAAERLAVAPARRRHATTSSRPTRPA